MDEARDVIMVSEITSAVEATEIAQSILEKEYGFRRPLKAQRTGDVWHVKIDVGVFQPRIASFKIDAKTGAVLEYEVAAESS
ncbi:MAG: hypothetical protein HY670_09955 [Chloroflexi bacterium]|nr:hypothetical protein [Chloroflexota bacterium]